MDKAKRLSLCLLVIFFITNSLKASKTKSFYLIDSTLISDNLSDYDKTLIDSTLQFYHTLNEDTSKLSVINDLASSISDNSVSIYYFKYMNSFANKALNNHEDSLLTHELKYYKASALYGRAYKQNQIGERDSALINYQLALNIFEQIDSKYGRAHTHNSIAYINDDIGNNIVAVDNYNKALALFEQLSDSNGVSICYLNISNLHIDSEDFEKAKKYINKAIEIAKAFKDYEILAIAYNEKISQLLKQNTYNHELDTLLIQANKIFNQLPERVNHAFFYANYGRYYQHVKVNYDSAMYYFNKVLEISKRNKYKTEIGIAYFRIGETYFFKKNYSEAKRFLNKADEIQTEQKEYVHLEDIIDVLKKIYILELNWEKAYELMLRKYKISQYISSKKFKVKLVERAYKYSYEKKKITDSLRNHEKLVFLEKEKDFAEDIAEKNKKLLILSILAGIAVLFIALFIIYQIQLKKRAELAEIKLTETENKLHLERQLNSAEMKALRAQMNPHFLFNAFNSIQEYIIMNNRELASDYLGKFADLMRIYLDHSREKTISLENEVEATELYLELEKIRFENKLNYHIEVGDNIDKSQIEIPPMLIQPFVENSLKHGLLHKKDDRQLYVRFTLKDNNLICIIEDNGVGRKKAALLNETKLKKHKSFATSATKNRIDLLNIGRENPIQMRIMDLKDKNGKSKGTKVELIIPI